MAALDFPATPTLGQNYTANGKTWQWDGTTWVAQGTAPAPTVPPLTTLHETIFAGMTTGNIPAGNPVINGVTWNVGIGTGGNMSIVATGLQATLASGSSENGFNSGAGEFARLVTQERWSRGKIGMWTRTASFNRGTATGGFCYLNGLFAGAYPTYGLYNRRVLNGGGMAINGGFWYGSETGTQLNGTASNEPSDVTLLYFRSPFEVEHWYGTWAGAWPVFSAMKLGAITRPVTGLYTGNAVQGMLAANNVMMLASGGQATNNTPVVIVDRFRITTYDP